MSFTSHKESGAPAFGTAGAVRRPAGARPDPVRVPGSTYRLQLNPGFNLRQAEACIEYLGRLGITDCYLSPVLRARPGSMHGYDITDHSSLNPELGTEADWRRFTGRLRDRGMGLLLDIVPNHMCISDESNRWWWQVLEDGPASPYAGFFDIDWNPPKEDLVNKILLPFLGDQYGRVLEGQGMRIVFEEGTFYLHARGMRFPILPGSWRHILEPALAGLSTPAGPGSPDVLELQSILTALAYLPRSTDSDPGRVAERQREKEVIRRRLGALVAQNSAVLEAVQASVAGLNGRKGEPASFDRLEALLADQVYRLSFWRTAADEINYRRFFDINELAAIRVEDPAVFGPVHALVLEWIRQGRVTGLRVDHPDGLFEPQRYLTDLQSACREALLASDSLPPQPIPDWPFFIVAEKILVGGEEMRPWPIEGTTGYGFLNLVNGLFVDSRRMRTFERAYRRLTGWTQDYEDLVADSKRLILQASMSSELNVLARRLDRISEQHRHSRDFTLQSLQEALREVVAWFPVYRTYTALDDASPGPEDERHLRFAITMAKRRNPATGTEVFDFIQSILLLQDPEGISSEQRADRRMFVMRLQQFTGQVMAKGLEDTAFYRYGPLASVNEVGGDPRRAGTSVALFHDKNRIRRSGWANALLSTSTHDTKRGEDARMRINALSEIPGEWHRAVYRWMQCNRKLKSQAREISVPSATEEVLVYQTLIGTWPFAPPDEEGRRHYLGRIEEYMIKALREAKVHSSWISPDAEYECGMRRFIRRILDPAESGLFLEEFVALAARTARAGALSSLSQVVLKCAVPGVPDFYQGSELWNLSLVDPDNRRPVDFPLRSAMLSRLDAEAETGPAKLVERLMGDLTDPAIKLYVTSRMLRFRRAHPDLFRRGGYVPLRAIGEQHRRIIAFVRDLAPHRVIVLAGRFFMDLAAGDAPPPAGSPWERTSVLLTKGSGAGPYGELFTGETVAAVRDGRNWLLPVSRAFARMPAAVLVEHD